MAECLDHNWAAVEQLLHSLTITHPSSVVVSVEALHAIASAFITATEGEHLQALRAQMKAFGVYDYSRSPLRFLEAGLITSKTPLPLGVKNIFTLLRRGSNGVKAHTGSAA